MIFFVGYLLIGVIFTALLEYFYGTSNDDCDALEYFLIGLLWPVAVAVIAVAAMNEISRMRKERQSEEG